MRMHLVLAAASASVLTAADGATISLSEVEGADPMVLAGRILPSTVRARIVEGSARRQFLPFPAFWAGFLTAARAAGKTLCARTQYSVQLSNPGAPGGASPGDSALTIGPVEAHELKAVVFPAERARAASCATTEGYVFVSDGDAGTRQLAAYADLITAMRQARSRRRLPYTIRCEPVDDAACRDARTSLAALPLDVLFDVSITGVDRDVRSEGAVRIVRAQPVRAGAPHTVEFRFGMSGKDGSSWRVGWLKAGRPLGTIHMERQKVFYH